MESKTTSRYKYSFFRVSKTEQVHDSAQKYRGLRLRALEASPSSFASTYETEANFTETDWVNILTAPDREIFICAAASLDHTPPQSDAVQWVGQVTLRGPLSQRDFTLPVESDQSPPKPDVEEERWQMLSLFTLPEHRGNGLGPSLCQEALEYLRTCQASPRGIRVRLMVKPENHVTVKLYQRLGFVEAGRCTLAEALIANGDGHLLPRDTNSSKYTDRKGLIMVCHMAHSE